jgi:hypothetical protein
MNIQNFVRRARQNEEQSMTTSSSESWQSTATTKWGQCPKPDVPLKVGNTRRRCEKTATCQVPVVVPTIDR